MKFDCPRTCQLRELCRFQAILSPIGPTAVYSHTVKVKVEYRDLDTLARTVKALGWTWHGQGTHKLYSSNAATGHGFTPAGWTYPAILDSQGELHYDTYNGQWGDDAQLDRLKAEYAMTKAQQAAEALGWQCERTAAGLTVHHPDGGILTVDQNSICETTGFTGAGCHDARTALGLLADGAISNKPEHAQTAAQVMTGS